MFRGHLIFLLLSMKFAVISLNFWKTFGCVYCVFLNQKNKLWWFWIPWDQNVPLKFYNAFYIWHHFICIWVHTRIVHPPWTVRSLYKNSRPLWLQTLYFFRLFLDKQKITDVVRLNKKIELNFMSWRIKNRRKKQNYHIQLV